MQNEIHEVEKLLNRFLIVLEESFSILPNYLVAVKIQEIKSIIEEIYKALPPELKEAENLLNSTKKLQIEAEKKAEQILQNAKNEVPQLISESNYIKNIQKDSEKFKEQTLSLAQEIRRKAIEDSQNYKYQIQDEAANTKQRAEKFAEQILKSLDTTLTQHLQFVKEGQTYLKEMHNDLD